MITYIIICNGHDHVLTDMQSVTEAREHAQRIANSQLASVWLSSSDSDSEELVEEFAPDEQDARVIARRALRSWEIDDAPSDQLADVFFAIFERLPEEGEDDREIVDLINWAADRLSAPEAARINQVI